MSTVCAISTPLGVGGISAIRLSGEDALNIADKIFLGSRSPIDMAGHTCAFGKISDGGKTIDDVLLTVFRAPKSYTGEDTVEISCHGGVFVTRRVLSLLIENGAKPAEAGEFTKRAFLNGKLDLTEAEGVMDIISSENERALMSANNMRSGEVFRRIDSVKQTLTALLSGLAAWADFPEEDVPAVDFTELKVKLEQAAETLFKIIKSCDDGMIFKNGVKTALVGTPNVGKSSVMNMLLGYDRSIVTDVAGTTRDVIEESARLGDIVLRLNDTAGIREVSDIVEAEGVRRAEKSLRDCALTFAVFDSSRDLNPADRELLSRLDKGKTVIVLNKNDLPQKLDKSAFVGFKAVSVSALKSAGSEELAAAVTELLDLSKPAETEVFASERQKECAKSARKLIKAAIDALEVGETADAVTVVLQRALEKLCELTGESAPDTVIDEVFSRFCVGK